uniref:Small cell adhesion glycoprotein n=1 Tax=Taeniopygia guttata TaxID=59729 RepID=A0A674GJ77_TAEGU
LSLTSLSPCPEEDLTTPDLRKAPTPAGREDADTAVIAVVITVVFLTLLSVLVVIGIYLYRNRGSYRTYEQAEPPPREEPPAKEKEEYFI